MSHVGQDGIASARALELALTPAGNDGVSGGWAWLNAFRDLCLSFHDFDFGGGEAIKDIAKASIWRSRPSQQLV